MFTGYRSFGQTNANVLITRPQDRKVFPMSKFLAILALMLGVALALFGAQNQDPVALHFLGFSSRLVPVSLAILAAAVVGLLVGLLVMLPGRITTGRIAGRLQRDVVVRDAEAVRIATLTQASAHELTRQPGEREVHEVSIT